MGTCAAHRRARTCRNVYMGQYGPNCFIGLQRTPMRRYAYIDAHPIIALSSASGRRAAQLWHSARPARGRSSDYPAEFQRESTALTTDTTGYPVSAGRNCPNASTFSIAAAARYDRFVSARPDTATG